MRIAQAESKKAGGTTTSEAANEWARNTAKAEERPPREEFGRPKFGRDGFDRGSDRKPRNDDDNSGLGFRNNNPTTPRKDGESRGGGPPRFSNSKRTEESGGGFGGFR